MVIVRFNQWEEFLEELKTNPPEDRTVRLTASLRYDKLSVPHVTMVAGYLYGTMIVECVHYLGLQPIDGTSQRSEEIRQLFHLRKEYLEELGFSVKSGRYHMAPILQR